MSKFKDVLESTKIDEAVIDFVRTFLSVSIAVALGLGIPILSIDGDGYKAVVSGWLQAWRSSSRRLIQARLTTA